MGNKDRTRDENAATSSDARDRDQESRDTALAKIITVAVVGALVQQKAEETQSITAAVAGALRQQKSEETQSITEAVAQQTKSIVDAVSKQKAEETQSLTDVFQRQMEETCAQYEELLKASRAQNFTSTLKVTSSTDGFRVMDPFDWTMDKNIYPRWQLWAHKARLALNAMEGDSDKTKISYLHHWLDGKGISKIKGWMNSKILISQEEYDALEERDRKGKYSLDKVELLFISRKYLDPQVKPFVSHGRTTSRKARFYDF